MIFYTGSYTQDGAPAANPTGKGIGCFELDMDTGNVKLLHYTAQRNPSYMVLSEDRKFLYAVEEMFENLKASVYAYKIGVKGELTFINKQKISGDYACHLAMVKDQLVLANYISGNVLSYPILEDGSLAPCVQEIKHQGSGPNKERQEAAHAHMVYPYRENEMFVVDLGVDKAIAYRLDSINRWKALPQYDISIEPGAGPRHMVMSNNLEYAYVLSELSGEVFVFRHINKFDLIEQISVLPPNFKGAFGGAAIRMHPNGKFLYVSCRGADVISVFKIRTKAGTLELVNIISSGGKTPRDFNIDPTGKWLVAANQDSNALVVFEINKESGKLHQQSNVSVDTPVNICWLE